jgi:hypothetical protein
VNHNAIASALAGLARPVTGIERADGFVPDGILPPNFYVAEIKINFDQTYGGMEDVEYICRVLVGHAGDEDSQTLLRTFLRRTGSTSIKAAIEGTPGVPQSLGGLCDDLHVRRFQGHRMYSVGTSKFYGGEWVVRVIGSQDED